MYLEFNVTNMTLELVKNEFVVENSVNYLTAKFNFKTDDWQGKTAVAFFSHGKPSATNLSVQVPILPDGTCKIPDSVVQDVGAMYVGVGGFSGSGASGVDLPTNYAIVTINQGLTVAFSGTGANPPTVLAGDMLKSVYDVDSDGIVDNAKQLDGHDASYFANGQSVTDESNRAIGIENQLRTDLTIESNARQTGDSTNAVNIANEVTRATSKENQIENKVDTSVARIDASVISIATNLATEISQRTDDINDVNQKITNETNRSTNQETAIRTEFAQADDSLQVQIDNIRNGGTSVGNAINLGGIPAHGYVRGNADVTVDYTIDDEAHVFNARGTRLLIEHMLTASNGDMTKSVYDINANGIVDNSERLGGELPSFYANTTDITGLQTQINDKSDTTYVDTKLGLKSDIGHVHAISEVTGLQTNLSTLTNRIAAEETKRFNDDEIIRSVITQTLTDYQASDTQIRNEFTTADANLQAEIDNLAKEANVYIGEIANTNAEITADKTLLDAFVLANTTPSRARKNNDFIIDTSGHQWIFTSASNTWLDKGIANVNNATTTTSGIVQLTTTIAMNDTNIPQSSTVANALNTAVAGLQTQIDGKEPNITSGTDTQYYRGDKTWQTLDKIAMGMPNLDDTSDLDKPISTDTQIALDGKVDSTGDTMSGDLLMGDGITNHRISNVADGIANSDVATVGQLNGLQTTEVFTVLNQTGATIPKGKILEQNSIIGAIYNVTLANANAYFDGELLIADEDILNGATGKAVLSGEYDLDTSTMTPNQVLFVGLNGDVATDSSGLVAQIRIGKVKKSASAGKVQFDTKARVTELQAYHFNATTGEAEHTAPINMENNVIKGLPNAATDDEAVNLGQMNAAIIAAGGTVIVDNLTSTSATSALSANMGRELQDTKLSLTGGTLSSSLSMGANKITSLASATVDTDAPNWGQVQTALASGNLFKDTFDAQTGQDRLGNPLPTPATENNGFKYICSNAGTFSGEVYLVNDIAQSNGTAWVKLLGSAETISTTNVIEANALPNLGTDANASQQTINTAINTKLAEKANSTDISQALAPKLESANIKAGSGIAVSTNGNDVTISAGSAPMPTNIAYITSNGSWVCPAGVTDIYVTVVGGGGGGGQAIGAKTDTVCGTGAGGNSGEIISKFIRVTPGNSYTISIGAAGAGGFNGDYWTFHGATGVTGGNTTAFGLTAKGGSGGGGSHRYNSTITAGQPSAVGSSLGMPGVMSGQRASGDANVDGGRGGIGYNAPNGSTYGTGGGGGFSLDAGYGGSAGVKGAVIIQY
jgi:hypothetical protein